mgnify:CR=1 FL=1
MGEVTELAERAWQGELAETQDHPGRALVGFEELSPSLGFMSAFSNVASVATDGPSTPEAGVVTYAELERRERENLLAALDQTDWKVSGAGGAARLLGVKPTTLNYRIKKMGLERPRA